MKIKDLITASSKWEDPDPAVRLNAIRGAPPEDSILVRLVREDPDQDVRIEAAAHLRSLADVQTLLGAASDDLYAVLSARLAALLAERAEGPEALAAIATIDDPATLQRIALCDAAMEIRDAALNRLDDQPRLLSIAIESNLAQIRQHAATRVTKPALVEQLAHDAQNRDKSVYKIAREKLALLHEAEQARAELTARCEELVDSLAQHAASPFSPTFERKWRALNESWQELERGVAGSDDSRSDEWLTGCRARIDEANAICAMKVAESQGGTDGGDAEGPPADDEAAALCAEIEALADALHARSRPLEELKRALAGVEQRWRTLPKDAIANEITERYIKGVEQLDRAIAADTRFEREREALAALLEEARTQRDEVRGTTLRNLRTLLERLNWPDDLALPDAIAHARSELARLESAREESRAREQEHKSALAAKLDELDAIIAAGELTHAEKRFKEIQHLRDQLRSRSFQHERINQQAIRIRELRDWQGYATNPKREELCERMESMIDAELHPRDRAERIKALQQEWKQLGPSHSYKSQKLWYRFKEAGDKAYAPCRDYFREQEKIRADNLRQRETICTQLETFVARNDWDHPDWKAVMEIVQTAKREWRRFDNVARSRRKSIQKRFYNVIDQLQGRLKEEQHRNRDRKQELIEKVQALTDESVELQTAINQAKELQRQWKAVGIMERKTDQSLWSEFRKHCDAVFARRDAESVAARKEEEGVAREAEAICRELEESVGAHRDDSGEALERSALNRARKQFRALHLPQRSRRALQARFDDAASQFEDAIRQREIEAQESVIAELRRRASLCCLAEAVCGAEALQEHERAWESAGIQALPPELAQRIEERWRYAQRIAAGEVSDLDTVATRNLEPAELLCIRAELLAGIESPPEAQPRLMQYQVERLNRELSRGEKETRSTTEQRRSLQMEWYCLGPLPAEERDALDQRFDAAMAALQE